MSFGCENHVLSVAENSMNETTSQLEQRAGRTGIACTKKGRPKAARMMDRSDPYGQVANAVVSVTALAGWPSGLLYSISSPLLP